MSIVNNTYRFIFVHVPKAAGTSVTNALSPLTNYCDQEIGGTAFGEKIQSAYRDRFGLAKHSTALEIRNLVGSVTWARYFTFAFARSPFTRALSTFHFLRKWEGGNGTEFFDRMRAFESFDEYVLSDIWEQTNGPDQIFRPQMYWLRAPNNGARLVSYVGKLETLDEDLDHILRVVEAPRHMLEEREVPHLNRSQSVDDSYTWEDGAVIDRIRVKYKPDFESLDYALDPQAA